MSVASGIRALATESNDLTAKDVHELHALADQIEEVENAKTGDGPVVGSDLSVFLRNISILGFVPALKQFILDIFNIKSTPTP